MEHKKENTALANVDYANGMGGIAAMFSITNPLEVEGFLEKNRNLFSILFEIKDEIGKYFADHETPILSYVQDPDIENFEELFVFIPYDCDFELAYGKYKNFKNNWLYPNFKRFAGLLNVDLENK